MKSQKFIFLFMAIFSFSSCIINVDNIPDSEVFKSFEPLEWSDDYVFLTEKQNFFIFLKIQKIFMFL